MAGLERQLRNDLMQHENIEEATFDAGRVLREVTATDIARPTGETEMPQGPELRATYWVFLDEPSTVLHMHFTSLFVPFKDGLLPLFDAIVSSLCTYPNSLAHDPQTGDDRSSNRPSTLRPPRSGESGGR